MRERLKWRMGRLNVQGRKSDDTALFFLFLFFYFLSFLLKLSSSFPLKSDRWSRWTVPVSWNPTLKPPTALSISSIECSSPCRRPTSTTRSRPILSSDTPRSFPRSTERDWRPFWPIPRVIFPFFFVLSLSFNKANEIKSPWWWEKVLTQQFVFYHAAGPYTVFAPTNKAFSLISRAELNGILNDPAKLTKLLQRHVVQDLIYTSGLQGFQKAYALDFEILYIYHAKGEFSFTY